MQNESKGDLLDNEGSCYWTEALY